ncbi:MAG: hypothetical protein DRH56_01760 [Deltaproteobacteria bacterium]|nr:MAG: hypothetical protein DRH56_01760 [Deltaproteobacteria bacterium]
MRSAGDTGRHERKEKQSIAQTATTGRRLKEAKNRQGISIIHKVACGSRRETVRKIHGPRGPGRLGR